MAKPKYRIPFAKDSDGASSSMLEYTSHDEGEVCEPGSQSDYWGNTPHEWRDNVPFKARVRLVSHGRGRSAVRVNVVNCDNGDSYSMGLQAFFDAAVKFGVVDRVIDGTWEFRKQGQNYTLWPS